MENRLPDPKWFLPAVLLFMILFYSLVIPACNGAPLTASWYSLASCRKEGSLGIMANGRPLVDENFTAASWDYPFGTKVRVTNLDNEKSVVVSIEDRGPAKRLYRQGRIIDLSVASFQALASLREGVIPVELEVMPDE